LYCPAHACHELGCGVEEEIGRVIDIFSARLKRPDLSIVLDKFLKYLGGVKKKNWR
jgi:hypothetical protein